MGEGLRWLYVARCRCSRRSSNTTRSLRRCWNLVLCRYSSFETSAAQTVHTESRFCREGGASQRSKSMQSGSLRPPTGSKWSLFR